MRPTASHPLTMGIRRSLTQGHETSGTRMSPTRRVQQSQRALTNAFHIAPSTGASYSFGWNCFLSSAARIPARLSSQLVQELPCHRRHYLKQCCVRLFSTHSVESDPASFPSSWRIMPWLSRRISAEGASFVAVPDSPSPPCRSRHRTRPRLASPQAFGTAPTAPQP